MAATRGQMECKLYPSAFSGEVIFQVNTTNKESYEGVAPKQYVKSSTQPTKEGVDGQVDVRVLANGGNEARVSVPDGQVLSVPADKVSEI
jgi:hypothetical protein